jgi:hypothetical protein
MDEKELARMKRDADGFAQMHGMSRRVGKDMQALLAEIRRLQKSQCHHVEDPMDDPDYIGDEEV